MIDVVKAAHKSIPYSGPAVEDTARPQPSSLQRAKTTINVPSDARERIRALGSGSASPITNPSSPVRGPGEGAADGLVRSATMGARSMSPANTARSLSVRRPGGPAPPTLSTAAMNSGAGGGPSRNSPQSGSGRNDSRLTEFYDDYINNYGEDAPPLPNNTQRSPDRVANWAKNNAVPSNNPPLQRSRSTAPSSYAPSSVGGTLRRKTTRRAPRATYYEEEEEGYASGDYDDAPFEMTKIRVKVCFRRI